MRFLVRACAPVAVLALAACSSGTSTPSPASPGGAAPLTLTDGWCKSTDSMPAMSKEMTGCFGTLVNTTGKELKISGGSTDAAMMVELHETVKNASGQMQMQPVPDGFTIPAGGSFALKPGANHVMLMKLKGDLKTGDKVTVTFDTSAGKGALTWEIRAFPGAEESYVPSPSNS
ncbi:MAG: copper chaperone PCu(A)C [Tetrasphaera sp.]|nr:copper chaperone PCu(A)C [Tetrasphaera sp.]